MKKKIKNHSHFLSDDNEIDLAVIINFVKKNLLILFSVIPICLAISLIYDKNIDKFFKTSLLVSPPNFMQFKRFYLTDYDSDNFVYYYDKFLRNLNINIISEENFKNFLLENKSDFSIKEIDKLNFKYEGKKSLTDTGIVVNKFGNAPYINDLLGSIYTIEYSSDVDGYKIIISYIENSIQNAIDMFKNEAIENLDSHIFRLKNDLNIAVELGIVRPFNSTQVTQSFVIRDPDYRNVGFFLGTEVLKKKINEIEFKKKNIETNNMNYKSMLVTIYNRKPADNTLMKSLFSGFIIGIFLTSIIIFLRKKKYKNN